MFKILGKIFDHFALSALREAREILAVQNKYLALYGKEYSGTLHFKRLQLAHDFAIWQFNFFNIFRK